MFAPKTTIVFAIFGIAIVLGFICGVAPGVFLQSALSINYLIR
jgi:hypothetical protein